MAPILRRTWSPRGQTPVLRHRTRHHQKVSMVAALCVAPNRDQLHLYFRLHPAANIRNPEVIAFLRQLLRQLRGHIVLLWDRLNAHRATETKRFLSHVPRLHPVFFPPYAPELNPPEHFWAYLKTNPLANASFCDLPSLTLATRHHSRRIQRADHLLRAFVKHSPLPLRLY
jgi:transposase